MQSSKCHSQCSSSNDRGWDPRGEVSSPVHHNLCHHVTPTSDQFLTEARDDITTPFKEHFPTAPLDDNILAEEQIPDRHLCIHERPDDLNHQCSYPCLYDNTICGMDLLQSTLRNKAVFYYKQMDFSDISSDLPDIMMMISDTDIPDLTDVLDAVWFA